MAMVSLEDLRARVREAADLTGSGFVTDAENSVDSFVNSAARELYGLLVAKFEDYFERQSTNLSLVAGTATYSLPTDFLRLAGVDVQVGSDWYSLRPGQFSERNLRRSGDLASLRGLKYRLEGKKLRFLPAPGEAGTARAWYVPQFSAYVNAADEREWYDWDEFIVQRAAQKAAIKEEADPSPFMAEAGRLRAEIEREADSRDVEEPASVGSADNSLREEWWEDHW